MFSLRRWQLEQNSRLPNDNGLGNIAAVLTARHEIRRSFNAGDVGFVPALSGRRGDPGPALPLAGGSEPPLGSGCWRDGSRAWCCGSGAAGLLEPRLSRAWGCGEGPSTCVPTVGTGLGGRRVSQLPLQSSSARCVEQGDKKKPSPSKSCEGEERAGAFIAQTLNGREEQGLSFLPFPPSSTKQPPRKASETQ